MLKKAERINYFVIFELLKGIKKNPAMEYCQCRICHVFCYGCYYIPRAAHISLK